MALQFMIRIFLVLLLSLIVTQAQRVVIFDIDVHTNRVCLSTNLNGPWSELEWSTNYSRNIVGYDLRPDGAFYAKGAPMKVTITNAPPATNLVGVTTNQGLRIIAVEQCAPEVAPRRVSKDLPAVTGLKITRVIVKPKPPVPVGRTD